MEKKFSVLNESSLHKSLKKLYSLEDGSKTEVELDGHIYDIITKEGNAVEIQNLNVSKLYAKTADTISKKRKITIVHPAVIRKSIRLTDKQGNIISERLSPKKGSIYSIFRELTGMHTLLLDPLFTLEVPLITMTEIRVRTDEKVQSKNNGRRFKRDWLKTDKTLNEILDTKTFHSADDYLSLLPENLSENFSVKETLAEINRTAEYKVSEESVRLMFWVFLKMQLLEQTEKRGNTKLYSVNRKFRKVENYGTFTKIKVK